MPGCSRAEARLAQRRYQTGLMMLGVVAALAEQVAITWAAGQVRRVAAQAAGVVVIMECLTS